MSTETSFFLLGCLVCLLSYKIGKMMGQIEIIKIVLEKENNPFGE